MSIDTITYERKQTGDRFQRDCCPADGIARASGKKGAEECLRWLLPASKKVIVDIALGVDYTVPEILVDQIRYIVGTSAGVAMVLVNINCMLMNDEGPDVIQVIARQERRVQPTVIYAAGTTADHVEIYY